MKISWASVNRLTHSYSELCSLLQILCGWDQYKMGWRLHYFQTNHGTKVPLAELLPSRRNSNFQTWQFPADKFDPPFWAMNALGYLSLFTAERLRSSSTFGKGTAKYHCRDALCFIVCNVPRRELSWRRHDKTVLPVLHAISLLHSDRTHTEVGAGGHLLSVQLKAASGKPM